MALHRLPSTARTIAAPFRSLRSPIPILILAFLLLPSGLNASLAQQATPVAGVDTGRTDETICTGMLQAAYQPAGDVVLDVGRAVFEPGTGVTWNADDISPSTGFDCVISGSYSLVIDGQVEVIRGSTGERESYAPGTEVTATAGDVVHLLDNDRDQTYRAVGDEPLVVVFVGLFQDEAPPCAATATCTPLPETLSNEWLGGMGPFEWSQTGLQGSDIVVTIRRVTLESGGSFWLTSDQPARTWLVEDGTVHWAPADEKFRPLRFAPGQRILFTPIADQVRIEIRNETEEPVVLIETELAPAEPVSATPVT